MPEPTQKALKELRATIKTLLPDADEVISYNIPTFKIDGKYVVYFAGYKAHVSIYPVPDGDASLAEMVAPYRAGKGTLRFPLGKPLPTEVITSVVKKLRQRA
jgi:uncharacterized protein YdhG (YjbR/CyaY superfamily)